MGPSVNFALLKAGDILASQRQLNGNSGRMPSGPIWLARQILLP